MVEKDRQKKEQPSARKATKEMPKAQAKDSPKPSRIPSKDMLVELPPRRAEFGGLIERRKLNNRAAPSQERRGNAPAAAKPNKFAYVGRARLDESKHAKSTAEDVSNTGTYFNSLDNSAITLADSGIFKPEREEPSFNPYNKGRN